MPVSSFVRRTSAVETPRAAAAGDPLPPDLAEALDDLREARAEAREEGFPEPSGVAVENAERLLRAMYEIRPRRYWPSPTPDGEIAIGAQRRTAARAASSRSATTGAARLTPTRARFPTVSCAPPSTIWGARARRRHEWRRRCRAGGTPLARRPLAPGRAARREGPDRPPPLSGAAWRSRNFGQPAGRRVRGRTGADRRGAGRRQGAGPELLRLGRREGGGCARRGNGGGARAVAGQSRPREHPPAARSRGPGGTGRLRPQARRHRPLGSARLIPPLPRSGLR